MAIEDILNQALIDVGYKGRPIADIYEGSPAARAALEVWGQTRDELLDSDGWPFSRRGNVPLVLLKGPPPPGGYNPTTPWDQTYPPPGWLYEYAYPDDCLDLKAVLKPPSGMFDLEPQPAVWRVDNDNSLLDRDGVATGQKKVILTNVKSASVVYIGEINDPAFWGPGFIASMVKRLGQKLALRLGLPLEIEKEKTAEGEAVTQMAERSRG